jgi:hypothetical protein
MPKSVYGGTAKEASGDGGVCPSPPCDVDFSVVPLGVKPMFQIVESFFNTVSHFVETHGATVVIGGIALVVVSAFLWILRKAVLGRGS